jgi:protein-S-isoprenylcysteine O-methyltransferase Ste14
MPQLKVIFIYSGSIFLFLFLAPGMIVFAGRLLDRLFHWPLLPWRYFAYVLGVALMLAGLSFVKAAWQILVRVGKGHPQEAFGYPLLPPTQKIVIDGPFAYTRNPMALGFLLNLLGILFIARSLSALMLLYPLLFALAILYLKKIEEPHLIRRFGQEYLEYRSRVSFLVPRVPD